jgi:LysM repeat protein
MILRITSKNVPAPAPVKTDKISKKQQNHIVLPKETLYSIAKKYGVTVEQIKSWNELKENSIKEGMILAIYPNAPASDKKPDVISKQPEPTAPVPADKPAVITSNKPEIPIKEELPADAQPEENLNLTSLSKKFLAQQKTGTPQTTKGTAALMATSSPGNSTTYFALHKTAPVGIILKIKNLENGKITYVKVIGKLPDLDENKFVMIRLSQGAAKALLMGYGKAYVEISYAQ